MIFERGMRNAKETSLKHTTKIVKYESEDYNTR